MTRHGRTLVVPFWAVLRMQLARLSVCLSARYLSPRYLSWLPMSSSGTLVNSALLLSLAVWIFFY
jgi:hypothetical protein